MKIERRDDPDSGDVKFIISIPREFIISKCERYGSSEMCVLITEERKHADELDKAARAYEKLSICYRLNRRPSEELFNELGEAEKTLKNHAKLRGR